MIDYASLSRQQWLDLAARFYAHLQQEFDKFASSDWDLHTSYLGWRTRDVLAHMSDAISVNFRQVLDRALAGDPDAPSEFNTFARNARQVASCRDTPVKDILREFWSGLESIRAIYKAIPDADWLKPAWFYVGRVNVRTLFLAQLGDNIFHERDILSAAGRWKGLDPEVATPLIDWFLRELRPALFRPERSAGLRATVVYRLTGSMAGEWTMEIADNACRMEARRIPNPNMIIEAETEELVMAAQGRAAPFVGRLARWVDWVEGPNRREEVVAAITGNVSELSGLLSGRVRISGDRALANRVNNAFWHFWDRTQMTERNIVLDRTSPR